MMNFPKNLLRRALFRKGLRRRRFIGGVLRGFYFHLDLRQDTQLWRGVYERDLQDWLVAHTPQGGVCLDVGAADGFFSLLMASLAGPSGRVYAFEPSERGDHIRPNLEANADRALAPVHIEREYAGAVSDGASRVVSVDDCVSRLALQRVDVVKIDVDGGEEDVLKGMAQTMQKFHPHLSIEVHSRTLLQAVTDICTSNGYTFSVVDAPPHEYRPIGFNPTVYAVWAKP